MQRRRKAPLFFLLLAAASSLPGQVSSLTLVFGAKDMAPSPWNGSARISQGRIERVLGHHFTPGCKLVEGNAWECSTHAWGSTRFSAHLDERPGPYATLVQPVGVTILYRAPEEAELEVKTPGGAFSFQLKDVPETGSIFPLQGTVEVFRTPVVDQITDEGYEDDYPAVAAAGSTVWVAWQAFRDQGDHVFLRGHRDGRWLERIQVTEQPADVFMPAVAALPGRVVVLWSERAGADWHVKARAWVDGKLGPVETVTGGKGNNIFLRAAADAAGNLHAVYQSFRGGRGDIWLRSLTGGNWGPEILLSNPARHPRASDWEPAIAVDRKGTVWVAWDSYETGSYNIRLRAVRAGRPGPLEWVTRSRRFHARPSLAVDAQDRLWVAWEEAPENWGKDWGFLLTGGTGLYHSRTIQVAVLAQGRWLAPLRQPEHALPPGWERYLQTPRLVADSAGRMWLLARPRTSALNPTSLTANAGKWEVCALRYHRDAWTAPVLIPGSVARNGAEVQAAPGTGGKVYVALVTDHKLWGPAIAGAPRNNDILFTTLEAAGPPAAELAPRATEPLGALPSEPRERDQIARVRGHVIQSGGRSYRIFRGDLHRHTEISGDGAGDGSLYDAYRYALDAADMDYLMVTDHQSGNQPYTIWRIEKAADMFHLPGFFVPLFGTERSVPYPNGHRNLIFTRRGVPLLPILKEEQAGKLNTGPMLYPYLRKYGGLATSHTSATGMGTDWRDNDPDLEPLVEIYQGARTSAEHEGAPLAPTEKQTQLHAGGYRPAGYVWNAWAKGYKLGVQASSDHISTHTSYACVLAETLTRQGLVEGIRRRHAYAATSNVLLDFRAGDSLPGDIARGAAIPELTATIAGTAPVKRVSLIRDNRYIYTTEPSAETCTLRYRDTSSEPGEHYYYLRVDQSDGRVAWSSPIWFTRAGP